MSAGVSAAAGTLRRMRTRVASGHSPSTVWMSPPPGYIIARTVGAKGATFCWRRLHAPRGSPEAGPCVVEEWHAIRLAWGDWERADRRLI